MLIWVFWRRSFDGRRKVKLHTARLIGGRESPPPLSFDFNVARPGLMCGVVGNEGEIPLAVLS
jgi:hypothetical protein